MLSYRHAFHAGNFADVLKHVVQVFIIESLKKKSKPFLYLDSHSGAGIYDLSHQFAQKNGEFLNGIQKVWLKKESAPNELFPYFSVISTINSNKNLQFYPGSPIFAQKLLRENDHLILTELHPTDFQLLKNNFVNDPRAIILKEEGFSQLKSKLPPISKRGFIMIDPSYEIKNDYKLVISAILEGQKRFATGIYAIWYPVISRKNIDSMIVELQKTQNVPVLQIELGIFADNLKNEFGMTSAGLFIINPPYQLFEKMQITLPWLHQILNEKNEGNFLLKWIVSE